MPQFPSRRCLGAVLIIVWCWPTFSGCFASCDITFKVYLRTGGEWQSGSKRRAAPSIWQGGGGGCTRKPILQRRWRTGGWRLSPPVFVSDFTFCPSARSVDAVLFSWVKIPRLGNKLLRKSQTKAVALNNSVFHSFCCKWENCHNKAWRSDLHTRINKSNIDSALSTWRVFASQTNECLAMLLFPGRLWLVLTDIQAFGGVIREPRGVSRGEAFSAGLLHSLSSPLQVIASSCTAGELNLKEACIDSPRTTSPTSSLVFLASLMPQIPQTTQMYLMLTSTQVTATE